MQRGSNRLSVHRDEEMKHELQELLRSGHPTRTEEWHDPEPGADDDPQIWVELVAPGRSGASLATARLELARLLARSVFPATPSELMHVLRDKNAPDLLIEAVAALPRPARYANLGELAEAVTRRGPAGT
ncbi:DUF2795 domain-containing protein [Streptomyces sp. NPDC002928]|uniref:DUF2795 domain-containing protein n=1 Tax=Streptomyces sp. NPDC002928 TaxID=3154440 RepID=UPI0033A5792C